VRPEDVEEEIKRAVDRLTFDDGGHGQGWEGRGAYYNGVRVGNVWPLRGFVGWRAFLDGIGTIGKFGTRREAEQALRDYYAGLDIEPW
jgi:hypothetical protein